MQPAAEIPKPQKPRRKLVSIPPLLLEGDNPPVAPPSGPGSRYAITPEKPTARPIETAAELPDTYGTGKLFLTARDPHWLYAAWDFSPTDLRSFNQKSRSGSLSLRIFEEAASSRQISEAQVHPESRHWFACVPKAETPYSAELGYYTVAGAWTALAKSRRTLTPPDDVAEPTEPQFTTIPAQVSFDQLITAVQEFATENTQLVEMILAAEAQLEAPVAQPGSDPRNSESSTPVPNRFEPAQIAVLQEFLAELKQGSSHSPARVHWTPEQTARLEKLIHLDSYRRVWIGSLEVTELVRGHLQEELSSIAAAELARRGELLDQPFGLSSDLGPTAPRSRKFWFNINAELIIYGATEPSAAVNIGGRTIKLRPDGTFSYRFALPDGRYELPVTAISPDELESRSANLRFMRASEYHGQVERHPQDQELKLPAPENT